MAFSSDFVQVGRIADAIGVPAALTLCGFYGKSGQRLPIPLKATADHVLNNLIGIEAFQRLVDAFGGQPLPVPEVDLVPLRRAGMVYRLSRRSVPVSDIAQAAGINPRTVSQIKARLRLEGFPALADDLAPTGITESEGGEL